MILLVMNDLKNRDHCLNGYGLLLGALHEDVTVTNAIGLHERNKCLGHLLVDEGAICLLVMGVPSS